jgi:hypothetical protein
MVTEHLSNDGSGEFRTPSQLRSRIIGNYALLGVGAIAFVGGALTGNVLITGAGAIATLRGGTAVYSLDTELNGPLQQEESLE